MFLKSRFYICLLFWLLAGIFLYVPAFAEPERPAAGTAVYKDGSGTEIRLVSLNSVVRPGHDELFGILFDIAPGKHIYWRSDGGAGLPTEIKWRLPEGAEGREAWSFPVLSEGDAPYLEYTGKALAVCCVHIPEAYAQDSFPVGAEISWLECGSSCIPGQALLESGFPVAGRADAASKIQSSVNSELADRLKALPRINLSAEETDKDIKVWREEDSVEVWLAPRFCRRIVLKNDSPAGIMAFKLARDGVSAAELEISENDDLRNSQFSFYAYEGDYFNLKLQPDTVRLSDGSVIFSLPLKEKELCPDRLRGDIVRTWPQGISAEDGWEADVTIAEKRPAGLAAALSGGSRASGKGSIGGGNPSIREGGCVIDPPGGCFPRPKPVFEWSRWLVALLLAFLGGILLNLMPCVFPVLSLKVMSFISHGAAEGEDPEAKVRESRRQAWGYLLGVMLSFALLASVILILRSLGEALGWGFQMQSPVFVACMLLLFWLLVLNLSGVFEIGLSLTGTAGDLQAKSRGSGLWASAGSGAVAVLAATPCSAPFMGSALGYTLQAPALAAFAVFMSLGLGMALPYVWLASSPSLLKRLPRPGRWMESLKQFLAFPLAAACAYFFWVFSELKSDNDNGFMLLLALVAASLAAWLYGRFLTNGGKKWLWLLFAAASAACLYLLIEACELGLPWARIEPVGRVGEVSAAPEPAADSDSDDLINAEKDEDGFYIWSEESVREALNAGFPVFIDFGAAWCLTCQVNEKAVLESDEAEELFRRRRVCVFKADWTGRNPEITEALRRLGRSGVPVYVCLKPEAPDKPILLPELLTYDDLEEAFETSPAE